MAKLYRARLFRLMLDDEDSKDYEVYRIGTVIVSKKGKNCKEFMYGVNLTVFDSQMGGIYNHSDAVGDFGIHFYNETEVKDEYIVLREDLSEKNLMTKKDLIKFNYDSYASMAMKLKKYEEEPMKKLFKTKNGVVYGNSIGRS